VDQVQKGRKSITKPSLKTDQMPGPSEKTILPEDESNSDSMEGE